MLPFVPFFALKDFGQMLIFSGLTPRSTSSPSGVGHSSSCCRVGFTRYQHLVVGALPRDVQEKVPLLPTLPGRFRRCCRAHSAALRLCSASMFSCRSLLMRRQSLVFHQETSGEGGSKPFGATDESTVNARGQHRLNRPGNCGRSGTFPAPSLR